MKTPEAVVFDLGKVLVDFDYNIAVKKIAAKSNGNCNLRKLIDQSPLLLRYETGLLTTELFFAEVRNACGYMGELDEFADIFGDIFTPIPSMVEVNDLLRARGIPTYILSNTNELAIRFIRKQMPFFRNFTDYVLSYEHRVMKPDAKIYEITERLCGRKGPEILYLDDRQENVDGGARRGWQTILHEDPKKSRRRMVELGLLKK